MAYKAHLLEPFLGRMVHVRLHNGSEYRGLLQEILEKENVIMLKPATFLRIDLIESIFWCPSEEGEKKRCPLMLEEKFEISPEHLKHLLGADEVRKNRDCYWITFSTQRQFHVSSSKILLLLEQSFPGKTFTVELLSIHFDIDRIDVLARILWW